MKKIYIAATELNWKKGWYNHNINFTNIGNVNITTIFKHMANKRYNWKIPIIKWVSVKKIHSL